MLVYSILESDTGMGMQKHMTANAIIPKNIQIAYYGQGQRSDCTSKGEVNITWCQGISHFKAPFYLALPGYKSVLHSQLRQLSKANGGLNIWKRSMHFTYKEYTTSKHHMLRWTCIEAHIITHTSAQTKKATEIKADLVKTNDIWMLYVLHRSYFPPYL